MKSHVADWQTLVYCLRIVPTIGPTIYLTDYPTDLAVGGDLYLTGDGYEFSGVASESSMSPGAIDLGGIMNVAQIDRDAVASGYFDNAMVYLFATSWAAPEVDEEPIAKLICGKVNVTGDRYTIELMMLIDALNQPIGKTYMATCPKQFGGQEFAGCKVDLGPITVTGTVTGVTSRYVFRDSSRTEAADYFGAGTIRWTTGQNVDQRQQEIKVYAADGTITIHETFHYPVEVGDTYELVPGCRKRANEDCRDKWANILNFGGFTRIPSSTTYGSRGTK